MDFSILQWTADPTFYAIFLNQFFMYTPVGVQAPIKSGISGPEPHYST